MKNKKFIYILLAIVLLAGFLWFRSNSTENGDPAGSLISSVVSDITDGGEILLQKAVNIPEGIDASGLQKLVMEEAEWLLLPAAAEQVSREIVRKRNET